LGNSALSRVLWERMWWVKGWEQCFLWWYLIWKISENMTWCNEREQCVLQSNVNNNLGISFPLGPFRFPSRPWPISSRPLLSSVFLSTAAARPQLPSYLLTFFYFVQLSSKKQPKAASVAIFSGCAGEIPNPSRLRCLPTISFVPVRSQATTLSLSLWSSSIPQPQLLPCRPYSFSTTTIQRERTRP
jgi:hypothetical protein